MFYLLDTFNKDIEEYCDAATAKVRQGMDISDTKFYGESINLLDNYL
jgi:hypothetical protein